MDQLDNRLNQLKQGYHKMPTCSSPLAIVEKAVHPDIGKERMKWHAHLPYVASFIGVLIIGSILSFQFLYNPSSGGLKGSKEEQRTVNTVQVTEEEIKQKHRELVNFYNEERKKFELALAVNAEIYDFIWEAKELVNDVGDPSFKDYQDKEELESAFSSYAEFVYNQFLLPVEAIELLNTRISFKVKVNVSQSVLTIIHKQRELEGAYTKLLDRPDFYEWLEQRDIEENVKKLNELEIENKEILQIAENILANGYYFVHNGEGMVDINIEYNKFLTNYHSHLSEKVQAYLVLKRDSIVQDGVLLISWDELEKKVLDLEGIYHEYSDNSVSVKEDYFQYLTLYLKGSDNSPAFPNGTLDSKLRNSYERVLTESSDTFTHSVIRDYTDQLQQANYSQAAVEDFDLTPYMMKFK